MWNFRYGLIQALISCGHQVVVLAPSDKFSEKLKNLGCELYNITIHSKGTHPLEDMKLLLAFFRTFWHIRPDILMSYTIKPVIYGGLVARWMNIPHVPMITGLGTAFIHGNLLTRLVEVLYRRVLPHAKRVFFLNTDDRNLFLSRMLVVESKVEQLPGEGVGLNHFAFASMRTRPADQPVLLMIARLLRDKGVLEYVEAARRVHTLNPKAIFRLLGAAGADNPTAISLDQVRSWEEERIIEYLGITEDVRPHIADADCVVLPSYREGIPRTLLEAGAMGRPIITTDVAGCRDIVEDGINGFLCMPRNGVDLAEKMLQFINLSHKQRANMGQNGRKKMVREFDEKIVIQRYLEVIREVCVS